MIQIIKPNILRILRVFYEHKKDKIHFKKIVYLSNSNDNSTLRSLRELVELKILKVETQANLKLYSINKNNVYISTIFEVFDKEKLEQFTFNIKKAINKLINIIDNQSIFIFGSYAKNTYTEKSDLDIFILKSNKDNIKEDIDISKIEQEYNIKINIIQGVLENTDAQRHIIETALPISNYNNFYKIYYKY